MDFTNCRLAAREKHCPYCNASQYVAIGMEETYYIVRCRICNKVFLILRPS